MKQETNQSTNQGHEANTMLPAVPEREPRDADGNLLHLGDRVFGYDVKDGGGYERIYGTLLISDDPNNMGHWYVEYDDGENFIVLSFSGIWKA